MPENELLIAYEKMLESFSNDEERARLQPLYKAVKNVEDAMAPMHRRDAKYGHLPVVRNEDRTNLMKLHLALGMEAEKLIASDLPEEQKDAVRVLSAQAAGNFRQLQASSLSKNEMTLPEVLSAARTIVVDTRNAQLNSTVGSAQNARQPLTFLQDSGKEVTGLFTSRKDISVWQALDKQFKEFADALNSFGPGGEDRKNILQNFVARMDSPDAAAVLGLGPNADRTDKLGGFYRMIQFDKGGTRQSKLVEAFTKISNLEVPGVPPLKERPVTERKMAQLLDNGLVGLINREISKYSSSIMNNTMAARIHDGARVDNRNAAMSAVASLLGIPKAVAKSVPMTVINKDGISVEGTFMMEAEGVDTTNLRPEEKKLGGEEAVSKNMGPACQSISNLQVLDYICGNTDRHRHNVAYQFDKDGTFIGVQGFDNDSSFGKLIPSDKDNITSHLVHIGQMGVISAPLAKRVRDTSPEMLKFTLRGFDLSEEELNAACTRMQQLKEAINKDLSYFKEEENKRNPTARQKEGPLVEQGHIRVLQPNEFRELSLDSLEGLNQKKTWYREHGGPVTTMGGNLFAKAFYNVRRLPEQIEEEEEKEYRSLRSDKVLGADNRANPAAPAQEAARAHELEKKMRNCTNFRGTSPEFQAMRAAVARYASFQDALKNQISNAKNNLQGQDLNKLDMTAQPLLLDSVVTFGDLAEIQRLSREVRLAAQTYLDKKAEGSQNHNSYTQRRIDVAKEVLAFAKEITQEEFNLATRNEEKMVNRLKQNLGTTIAAEDAGKKVQEKNKSKPQNIGPRI